MAPAASFLRIALLCALFSAGSARAGLFDDDEARRAINDMRTKFETRFDQQAKAQLELSAQLTRQAEEIAKLRGQVETLSYELETAKKRQQDYYLDLDNRLRRFEPQSAASHSPAANGEGGQPARAAGGGDSAQQSQEYEAALNQFKANRFKDAAAAFAAFVQKHPDSTLAANAQYWLGNAWYAQRNCSKAIEAQSQVVSNWPDSAKAPDSLLAIATCQQEMGNPNAARRTLDTLAAKYPDSPAAASAKERSKKR